MRKFILLMLLVPLAVQGQNERPGSTSAQFLKLSVSPRAASMADAYISMADGPEATVYNPAALAWINNTQVAFTHTAWFAGINHEFAAIVRRIGNIGTFGLSMTALYTDEMKVRTPLRPDGTGETFFSSNYRIGISFSRFLTDRVTFGTTVNYIYLSLYSGFDDHAVSADVAAFYVTDFRDFKFGMKIANFGSEIKFVNEPYPLPVNFTFGLSINALENEKHKTIVSINGVKPNDGKPLAQFGAEWNYNDLFFLRGGYHANHEVEKFGFGAGLQVPVSQYEIRFDYSYNDFSLLGGAHRFGVVFRL